MPVLQVADVLTQEYRHQSMSDAGSGSNGGSTQELDGNTLGVLRKGHTFHILSTPENTWTALWEQIRVALASRGHTAFNIRCIHRVNPRDLTSRWKRQQLVCKCSGLHRNKKFDLTCMCPFKVTITWPIQGVPNITQVDLNHNDQCTAEAKKTARAGTCVACSVLQDECEGEVREWTLSGVTKTEIFGRLEARYYPFKLGDDGRRKVRNMAAKVEREVAPVNVCSPESQAAERAIPPPTHGGKRRQCAQSPGAEGHPSLPSLAEQNALLNNLQGIANREARRLCANIGPGLSPEMAVAVFKGLRLQVDALLGSPVLAACQGRACSASSEAAMNGRSV